jgi:hypothetical protein
LLGITPEEIGLIVTFPIIVAIPVIVYSTSGESTSIVKVPPAAVIGISFVNLVNAIILI